MRTAFLVLAHDQPTYLGRLVRCLQHPDTVTYVHVDERSGPLTPFADALPEGVELITRRPVHWGGMSVLQATLDLLRIASHQRADRYVLLSGSDLLVRPLTDLFDALTSPTEYLWVDRTLDGHAEHTGHVRRAFFNDTDNPLLRRLNGCLPRLRQPPLPLVQGSQWWALTDACVQFVLARLDAEPDICAFLARSQCPDEIAIASVVADSPFADAISDDYRDQRTPEVGRHALHYIDWSDRTAISPRVLDDSDLGAILESGAYFARKIRLPASEHLVRQLAARMEDPRYAC